LLQDVRQRLAAHTPRQFLDVAQLLNARVCTAELMVIGIACRF
jgi:hypothetical protein